MVCPSVFSRQRSCTGRTSCDRNAPLCQELVPDVPVERFPILSRQQWLELRKPVLTASDIGAAAGLDQHRSAYTVWLEKAGLVPPQPETPIMRRGRLFEPAAEAYLQDELPDWRIARPNVFLRDLDRLIGATPDRLLEDPDEPTELVNCQIKVVARPEYEKWDGTPPLSFFLQTCCENLLLDASSGVLACLIVDAYGAELELHTVPRHKAAEERVVEIARDFWDSIVKRRPPQPDYQLDGKHLAAMFPPSKAVAAPLDLTSDNRIIEVLDSRDALKATVKAATAEIEALDAEIVDKLRGAESAFARGWRISRTMQHRGEHTVAASSFPVLRVTKLKEQVR